MHKIHRHNRLKVEIKPRTVSTVQAHLCTRKQHMKYLRIEMDSGNLFLKSPKI